MGSWAPIPQGPLGPSGRQLRAEGIAGTETLHPSLLGSQASCAPEPGEAFGQGAGVQRAAECVPAEVSAGGRMEPTVC